MVFRRSRQRGMTLIEVLVAMAVFAVGILGILPMFLYSTQQNRMQRDKEIVSQVIVDWFGRLDALSYPDLTQQNVNQLVAQIAADPVDPNTFPDPNRPIPVPVKDSTGLVYTVTIDIDDADDPNTLESPGDPNEIDGIPSTSFKRATIEVDWQSLLGKLYSTKVARLRLENAPRFSNFGG